MTRKTVEEYWNELNKMYGLDLELPKDFDLNPKTDEIAYEMAMGKSFDNAMQNTF